MSIDSSLVRSLNTWGASHKSLVHLCSNDFVYLVILISVLWFAMRIIKTHPISAGWKDLISGFLIKGIVIFAIPVGIAIVVSEGISRLYVRQRPFVADPTVKLLVPHGADGGMPSHHLAVMVALIVSVYFYDRRIAALLALLAVLTGIARVAAGIHYPSDILVGAALGVAIVYIYRWALVKFSSEKQLALD